MKRTIMALLAMGALALSADSQAIPQNLPHHNSADVDSQLRIFIPYTDFALSSAASGELTSITSTANALVTYITTNTVAALKMTTSNADVPLFLELPDNTCVDCQVQVSVVWSTNDTTTADTATWRVLYGNAALGASINNADTALSTAITADSVDDSSFGLNETPLGTFNANVFTRNELVTLLVDLNSTSGLDPIGQHTVLFHGINLYFTREKL